MAVIISFGVSLLGLIALFSFKCLEARHSFSAYGALRLRLDRRVERGLRFLFSLPRVSRAVFLSILHELVFRMSEATLRAVRFLERRLFKFVNMVKGRGEINRKKGSVSLFLASITREKKTPRHFSENK